MIYDSLWQHQKDAIEMLRRRKGKGGLFMEMGTGKTRTALAYLEQERFRRILIPGPISVLSVWEEQLAAIWPDADVYNFADGSAIQSRTDELKRLNKSLAVTAPRPTFLLCNFEAYWREPLRTQIRNFKADAIVPDEAHRLKNRGTRQSRFSHILGAEPTVQARIPLTGTPVTNGLEDLYSLYRFLDPTVFGTRWSDFEWRYIIKGGFGGYQITGYRNTDEADQKVADTSFQIAKSDALDLPPVVDVVVPVRLSPATRAKYNEFRRNAVAEMEGTDEFGRPVTGTVLARIVLSSILRLSQIANGFVGTETGQVIDLSTEKIDAAGEIVENATLGGERVVIFCRFRHDIARLEAAIPNSTSIHGDVPPSERVARMNRLRSGDVTTLICQIQVASLGIDLTAASQGIFYSTGFSLSDFEQARARLDRFGQTRKVTFHHLLGDDTVDRDVYDALAGKQNIASLVVRLDYARRLLL